MKKILLLLLMGVSAISYGQISYGGAPRSFYYQLSELAKQVVTSTDVETLKAEDETNDLLGDKPRFAVLQEVDFDLENSGVWDDLLNDNRIWRLQIEMLGVKGLGLYFDDFYIPKGAEFYVYNETKTQVLGKFTEENNHTSGAFVTSLIQGESVVLEYYEPSAVYGEGVIHVSGVAQAYRMVNGNNESTSSSSDPSDDCEVDVNCSEGNNWQDEKRGVVRMSMLIGNSLYWCSGSVVNNTANDCTPYVLSAWHCGEGASSANMNQWVFYFNYESSGCGSGYAPTNQTVTGASMVANSDDGGGSSGSDFMLVELNSNIPTYYNAYYNGWSRYTSSSSSGVGIHHPSGDRKKISTYNSSLSSTQWGSASGSHWKVYWSATANGHGVTEGGSSGSSLFNSSGLIVGTLTGGSSYCSSPNSPDYYGKMSYHWQSNGSPNDERLKPWLDPVGSNVYTLAGTYYPCSNETTVNDAGISAISYPESQMCEATFYPVATLTNYGSVLTSVTITYTIYDGVIYSHDWTGFLEEGESTTVTLPSITVPFGSHDLAVSTNTPNGESDIDNSNNYTIVSFLSEDCSTPILITALTLPCGGEILQVTNSEEVSTDGGEATSETKTIYAYAPDNALETPTYTGYYWPYVTTSDGFEVEEGVTANISVSSSGVLLINGWPAYQWFFDASNTDATGNIGLWNYFELNGDLTQDPCPVLGCTDPSALNYNATATEDDGSCEYDVAACVNPSSVWTQNVVHTRATIKWTDMHADRYLIKGNGALLVAMGTVGDGIEAGVQKTTFNVVAGTTYELTMRTFCMDGSSTGWENVGSFTTLPECVNPEVFSMNFVESEWAELSWDHAGNALGENMYMGELRNVTEDGNWGLFAGMISSNPGVDQPMNFKLKAGLVGGHDYEYRLKTWCNTGDENNPTDPFYRADGFGPAIGSFTTIPCAIQTENLTVDYNSSNANGANHAFGWDVNLSTEGAADRYLIQFTVVGAGNWQNRTVSGGGTATGRNIGGFTVGTEYNWRARTICSTDPTSARWRSDWVYGPSFVAGDGARLANSPVTQLDVYPNPSRDIFNVTFASEEVQNINIKVVNVIGETIYTEQLKEFTGQYTKVIDLTTEAKGIYTLQITTESGGVNKKIVLQ
jgi:hypothetical protein